jgi:hypothetical protein
VVIFPSRAQKNRNGKKLPLHFYVSPGGIRRDQVFDLKCPPSFPARDRFNRRTAALKYIVFSLTAVRWIKKGGRNAALFIFGNSTRLRLCHVPVRDASSGTGPISE